MKGTERMVATGNLVKLLFLELRDQADGLELGIDGKRAHFRERFIGHEKTPLRDESGSAEKDPAADNL